MDEEVRQDSVLGNLVQGILCDYLGKAFTRKKMQQATARIVKSFLMTREGANLPPEGTATNFSDNEVKGNTQKDKNPEPPKDDPAIANTRVRGIVATPGFGPDGSEVGPVTYRTPL
jgi:hypothetical protein